MARVLIARAERPSPPEFHRKRGVLPILKRRIRRIWAWYLRGSLLRSSLQGGCESCPTLRLDGFHRKRGVRVRRFRLDVRLEGLVYFIKRPRRYYRELFPLWTRSDGSIAAVRVLGRVIRFNSP